MKLCHIFSAGKHTDSKGNTREWTEQDLDKIVHQFNTVHSQVPICVGHPQSNSPAYGWFKDVLRVGKDLYCSFKDVQEEFKTAVNKGLFKNRSISLDKDLNIRHLAFLGGQAPAVKGLEQFCFEENEDDFAYEFSDYEDLAVVEKEEITMEKGQKNKMENEELKKELEAKDKEIAELKRQAQETKQAQRLKEFEDFADSAIEKGNILPKHKESIINILTACDAAGTFNFSDSEKSGVDVVKEFVSELKMMNFEDIAKKDDVKENQEFSDAAAFAQEIQKLTKQGMSEVEAYSKLVK